MESLARLVGEMGSPSNRVGPGKEDKEMEQQAYQLISIGLLLVVVVIALTLGRK